MKKLLIIMTLFMSSFFLFFSEDVKAYEYEKEVDFSVMEDVLPLIEKLDEFVETDTEYSDYYFIYLNNGTINYYIIPLDGTLDNVSYVINNTYYALKYNSSIKVGTNLNSIYIAGGSSSGTFYTYHSNNLTHHLLYMNFDYYFTSGDSTIIYTYNDFSVVNSISTGNKFLTLYDVYLDYQVYLGNKELVHKEEIAKVGNFYTVVIDRISYVADTFASNYIYLSIIVIFLIIFVFQLIFRRYL